MARGVLEPQFARRFSMLVTVGGAFFFVLALQDFRRGHLFFALSDLVPVVASGMFSWFIDRELRESDAIGARVARLPSSRRRGLRDMLDD